MNDTPTPSPYRSTPVFDEATLPAALRREHRTKLGVWGVIRVLDGELKLTFTETGDTQMLSPGAPGLILPDQPHLVEPQGPVRMQVDFTMNVRTRTPWRQRARSPEDRKRAVLGTTMRTCWSSGVSPAVVRHPEFAQGQPCGR